MSIWFLHLDFLILGPSPLYFSKLASEDLGGSLHISSNQIFSGDLQDYGLNFQVWTWYFRPAKHTNRFCFFAVPNSLPFILHHFSWAGNPKEQPPGRGLAPCLLPLNGSGIIQSAHSCKAWSSNKGRQSCSQDHAAHMTLFSSLQAPSNGSKINPHPKGKEKNQAYFHKFFFCFVLFFWIRNTGLPTSS